MTNRITEGEQDWHKKPYNQGICRCTDGIHLMIDDVVAVNAAPSRDQIIADHNALRDARGWAVAKEAFRLAEETRARIGDENTKSRGGQTPEYGEAYRASGVASKVLFEAETKLLAALRQPASGDVNWGDMDWEPVSGGNSR